MRIERFEWDEHNAEHMLARHAVTPEGGRGGRI